MKMFLLSFCLLITTAMQAQEMHYWTQQFGARASLLGGAVIHGLDGNSSVYYNPANLAYIKQATISLNTSLYKFEDITVKNGGGTGVDLKSQRISLYQNMISGLLSKNPEKKYRIGFNIITRNHANFEYSKQNEGFYELISSQDGEEYYIGNVDLQSHINETWACIGGGYRLHDNFSVGLTAIITYRNQRHALRYSGRALNAPDSTAIAAGAPIFMASNSFDFDMRSNLIGGLLKAGFHGRIGAWRFGLNISSPSITIWGESKVHREEAQTNLPGNRDQIKTDEQRNLRTEYRHPLTIGTGIGFLYKKGMVSIAAEYFFKVNQYEMIKADPTDPTFPSYLSNGVEKFLTVYQGADAVINFGLGWEHLVTEKVKLHFGIRTDFTYARTRERVQGLTVIGAPLDIYHFSAGVSFKRRASKISFGINYSYASRRIFQLINLSDPTIDPSEGLFLFGKTNNSARVTAHSVTAMIGYTYYFALK